MIRDLWDRYGPPEDRYGCCDWWQAVITWGALVAISGFYFIKYLICLSTGACG